MSAIFGLVDTDGPTNSEEFNILRGVMSAWGPDRISTWGDRGAALGECLLFDTPEAGCENGPSVSAEHRFVLAVEARLDNRDELLRSLDIPSREWPATADGTIVRMAYGRWGVDCVTRMYGDWSFAAWHPDERRLFLARDHFGQTALYYTWNGRRFAFASDKTALLAMPSVSNRLDEYQLALRLVVSLGEPATDTVFAEIQRLIPAHTATLERGAVRTARYWTLDDAPAAISGGLDHHADGLKAHLDTAVTNCLRSPGPVGLTLSGGLDSGSVGAIAAPVLAGRNQPFHAFTAVPIYDTTAYIGDRVGDEFPRAAAVVRGWSHVTHHRVDARSISPIGGAKRMLELHWEPTVAVANQYWIVALLEEARRTGIKVLLTGQQGNGALSWEGVPTVRSLAAAIGDLDARRFGREAKGMADLWCDQPLRRGVRALRSWWRCETPWAYYSPLRAEFAARVRLVERMRDERVDRSFLFRLRDGRRMRALIMRPMSQHVGARWARLGAAYGMVTRDPTADVRLMMFAHRIPEHHWRGAMERWVLRHAMRGVLPDEVRLARAAGRQSGDLVLRLRDHAEEARTALSTVALSSLAREYLDISRLEGIADRLLDGQITDHQVALSVDTTVLMRGIGHGLFLASVDS